MPELELSFGPIEYQDTGGGGPAIVLLHGVLMDGSLWRKVVPALAGELRCIVPTLPLGGHRRPMNPDADLTLRAQARLVAELLERLDLHDVTLVSNDWGGAQVLVSEGCDERVGRLVLASCEAFDNYPPGLPGRNLVVTARIPGALYLALQGLRLRPLQRLPISYGWMCKRPIPAEVLNAWLTPARTQPAIRRDARKYMLGSPSKAELLEMADRQAAFRGPVLIAWASEDRVMPPEHGRRLAKLFTDARLVEIADSYTLIPEDRPADLARAILEFVRDTPLVAAPAP